jgi:putative DNA primase/helicase
VAEESASEYFKAGGVPYALELVRNQDGAAKALLYNAVTIIDRDPVFLNGAGPAIKYDNFRCRTMVWGHLPWDQTSALPRQWEDQDDRELTSWLQYRHISIGQLIVGSAVQLIAERHKYHPVMDYLASLHWDGIKRLDEWLIRYCGVEDTLYTRDVGAKWMISAVARVNIPGCQADCALILEGPQGIRKTTTFNILGGAHYTNDIAVLGTTVAQEQILGKWIVELDELQAVTRASDVAAVTAFISRRIDDFRLPYGHRSHAHPRQCVFGGTTNRDIYLRDETGGRRYWPVRCGYIDIDALRQDRDQLWAEARDRFNTGETWWLDDPGIIELAREQQEERFETDPWEEILLLKLSENGLSAKNGVTLNQVFESIGVPIDRRNRAEGTRILSIIRHLRWEKRKIQHFSGASTWKYFA